MTTNEFQEMCAKTVGDIDAKYNIIRDPHFSFTQFIEEVGELAKEINKPRLRNKEIDRENLNGEFADVALQFYALAKILNVDVDEAVASKTKILKERHNL
ncbi:MAG: MazG nucleotide pyrophosphohydrolase domain-containing protein [Candidatus Moranbacteria bacterium]|nr:MazG nucleotide pyrophosphohydrolase domain-containing protein [Candidatus Moranbacteria bacterium]